jgi:hypothetical protein
MRDVGNRERIQPYHDPERYRVTNPCGIARGSLCWLDVFLVQDSPTENRLFLFCESIRTWP